MTANASLDGHPGATNINSNDGICRTKDEDWNADCKRFVELEKVSSDQLLNAPELEATGAKTSDSARLPYTFRCYNIDPKIRSAVMNRNCDQLPELKPLGECTSARDYKHCLIKLLEMEEVYQSIEMRQVDQCNAKIILEYDDNGNAKRHIIKMPYLSQCPPFDYLVVKNLAKTWSIIMRVIREPENDLVVLNDKACVEHYSEQLKEPLTIAPFSSGTQHAICQLSIEAPISELLIKMIVDEVEFDNHWQKMDDKVNLELTNTDELLVRLNKLSESQRRAVTDILEARLRPRPYIVTGTSSDNSCVLVEAVVHIYKRTNMNVLVCAHSDDNLERLADQVNNCLPSASMLRLKEEDNARFVYCNQRIVFAKSIKVASLRVKFDYVLLDGANRASVPESLVPASMLKDTGCFVLAGVPGGPGPDVRCKQAAELGLNSSLLDGLFI